jgi:nucleoid-associated protein YgaU
MNIRTNMKAGAACYTVQSGDSLSTISQQFYGNQYPSNVDKIYYSNQATIGPNKSAIYPGQKLYIPD